MALGYTMILPNDDRYLQSKAKLEDMIAGILGGRAAEEVTFGDITTGASDDLEKATKMARVMVTQYGMSDKLGPRTFGQKEELVFLGREIGEQRDYSEQVAQEIDAEMRDIIGRAYNRALEILRSKSEKLQALAEQLIERETLEAHEVQAILA